MVLIFELGQGQGQALGKVPPTVRPKRRNTRG
jgi:hypothetical protein